MATVVPPPSKKRRVELAELAQNQEKNDRIPGDAGSVRVQFKDQESGDYVGAPILVPLTASTVENLERIYNSISNSVGAISFLINHQVFLCSDTFPLCFTLFKESIFMFMISPRQWA